MNFLQNYTVKTRTILALALLSLLVLILFHFPNGLGAADLNMLSIFEPDEYGQYPHLAQMLDQPAETFMQSVYRFVQYKHYYYGFPFYFYSALVVFTGRLFSAGAGVSLDLLILRQMVSVLPMLAALWLMVYLQTRFESVWRSVTLFVMLASVPMVIENNLWWHPESLSVFFTALVFYFLWRDDLSFGRNFKYAAVACGLAAAVKLIGLFFFAAIAVLLLLGWAWRKISASQIAVHAIQFVAIMAFTFIASNPFLVFQSEREQAVKIQSAQAEVSQTGFVLAADSGPATWLPILERNYAALPFILLSIITLFIGIADPQKRILHLVILFWCAAFGGYLLFIVALKHKYYFLPVMLPLFSTLPNLLDVKWNIFQKMPARRILPAAFLLLAASFSTFNLMRSSEAYIHALAKETESPALKFYAKINADYLTQIVLNRQTVVYRHVRVYIPDEPRWDIRSRWGLLSYAYIEKIDPDVIVLWNQELHDFTNEGAANSASNPQAFAEALPFYRDALNHTLRRYTYIYSDGFGVLFVKDALATEFLR